jgi:WD40 repeat protein
MQPPPPVAVLRGHQKPVQSIHFLNNQLLSASHGCELFLWDLQTRRIVRSLHNLEDNDDGLLRVCSDDTTIACNSRLGRLFFYDLLGNLTREVETHISGGFCGCRLLGSDLWFPDAFNGRLCVYDTKSNNHFPVIIFNGHGMMMDVSVKNETIAIAFEDSVIAAFDSRNAAEPVWQNDLKLGEPAISIALVSERRCIVGSAQRQILEVGPHEKVAFYEMPDGHLGIDDIAVRCDQKIWATGGWDGRVRLFDAKKKKPLAVLKHHTGGVHTVAFASDGLLASAGNDRGIAIWSLYR